MSSQSQPLHYEARGFKALYVRALLRFLPHLINVFRRFNKDIQAEIDYLPVPYVFMLRVEGSHVAGVYRTCHCGSFHRVPPERWASDVEPGSGRPSSQKGMVSIDYVIAFRSLDYAFSLFSGEKSLKQALAERSFTTRGPNDTGIALTYLFTALLRTFFFWRDPYKRARHPETAG